MKQFLVFAAVAVVASAHHEHTGPYNYPRPSAPFSVERYTVSDDDAGLQVAPLRAIVRLASPVGNNIHGNVTFTQLPDGKIHVVGDLFGLPKGEYGFHVHEKGDITGGCLSTGGHFNPEHKDHGHPKDANRHVGDLGNVIFDENMTAHIDFNDSSIALIGAHGILGRALVLHEGTDDYGKSSHPDSKKTGNAGGRAACGVIGILDPVNGKAWKSGATLTSPIVSVILVPILAILFLK